MSQTEKFLIKRTFIGGESVETSSRVVACQTEEFVEN
jgi:hypothetical protein